MYMTTATYAQFEAKWTQLVTLAGQLERSAQIQLPTLIAIGHEFQTTLDQCKRLASKSPQLEGEHEVVADLVIGYDLAMAQNKPKLTADWFTHKMSATPTPAAAASKNWAMQELKDQRALGGKEAYQSISTWQQTAPTSPWYSSTYQPGWGGGSAYSPPPPTSWGRGAHIAPPPPRLPTRALHTTRSRPRSWPGQSPGRAEGCWWRRERWRRRRIDVFNLHQRGQASQSLFHSVASHHVPQVRSTRTRPAPLPQLESIGRRQRQYRVERKVPVSTNHFSLDQQRHGC